MSSQPQWEARGRLRGARERPHIRRLRRRVLAGTSVTLMAALAALPTTATLASAAGSPPGGAGTAERPVVPQLVTPGELLSPGQLQQLLATLPLSDLSAAQLAHHLAELKGVSVLAKLKLGLLGGEQLLGAVALEESLRQAIEQLGAGAKLGEVAGAEGITSLLPKLEKALASKVGGLGLLQILLGELTGGGLGGAEGALGSLSLNQLIGELLSTARAEETPLKEALLAKLAVLTNGLFGELASENKLEELLGGLPTGEFAPESVKEVSEKLDTTPEQVSEQLGLTSEQLPEDATMLTAPLSNGKLAGVAPAVKGLVTGLLGGLAEEGKGKEEGNEIPGGGSGEGTGKGEGGNGSGSGASESKGGNGSGTGEGKGGSGSGGQGGPGGSGSGGTGGATTVVLSMPAGATTTPSAATKPATGRVSVVAHSVRGHVATIVLRVPAAGTASISGRGVHRASKQAAKAERLTLRVPLTGATAASLRRHHNHGLAVRLTAAFHPSSGSSSSATVTVVFK